MGIAAAPISKSRDRRRPIPVARGQLRTLLKANEFEPRKARDASWYLLWPLGLAWLSLKCWLTLNRYFNADCYECMHQGWLLHQGLEQYVDFKSNHPPLPFQILSWLYYFWDDPTSLMMAARGVMLFSTLLVAALVWQIARQAFGGVAARWALIVHLSSVTYLEYSTMIRMDGMMIPFWLGAVALMTTAPDCNRRRDSRLRLLSIGCLAGLALWSNQKFLLLGIPSVVFAFSGGPSGTWRWRTWLWALGGALIPTGWYLGRATLHGSLQALLDSNLGAGVEAISEATYAGSSARTFFSWWKRDTACLVLAAVATGWGILRWRSLTRSQRHLLCYAPWLVGTIFMTPCPFAYYLACLGPLMSVLSGGFLAQQLAGSRWRLSSGALFLGLICVALAFPAIRAIKLVSKTNEDQLAVIRLATSLAGPDEYVFDGAGIAFTRPDAYGYDWILWKRERWRLKHGLQPQIWPYLQANECRVVIENKRIVKLPHPDREQVLSHYVRLWGPVFVPGFATAGVGEEPVAFELWFDGTYEFNQPTLLIDGQEVHSPAFLKAGNHRVAIEGNPQAIVIRDARYRELVTLPEAEYPRGAKILP